MAGEVETETAPLTVPATGDGQRVQVTMPDGFEYREMEVALAKTLGSSLPSPLSFKLAGTHSSLAVVEHAPEGSLPDRQPGHKTAEWCRDRCEWTAGQW